MGQLSTQEVGICATSSRSGGSLSLMSTLILINAFIFIKRLRTMSTTLLFFASPANFFAAVAALMGNSALSNTNSPSCQFQGFLLEWFMQADALWSCAMAINVYLVVVLRWHPDRIKKLQWAYVVICYGVPLIPALFLLFFQAEGKGKVYGNATLWCWIDEEYASVRIWSYYLPVWISIAATLIIYIIVGNCIFETRSRLRDAANGSKNNIYTSTTPSSIESQPFQVSTRAAPFSGLRTTDIHVSTDWDQEALKSPASVYAREDTNASDLPPPRDPYSITISGAPKGKKANRISALRMRVPRFKRPAGMDEVKWAYTKTALLFATSILITWVPASVNRIYGLLNPHNPSFALSVASAIVLPLQGFWTMVIFCYTSKSTLKKLWAEYRQNRTRIVSGRPAENPQTGNRSGGFPARSGSFARSRPRRDTLQSLDSSDESIEMTDRGGFKRDDSESSDLYNFRSGLEAQRETSFT